MALAIPAVEDTEEVFGLRIYPHSLVFHFTIISHQFRLLSLYSIFLAYCDDSLFCYLTQVT